jgi:hypothetical protein
MKSNSWLIPLQIVKDVCLSLIIDEKQVGYVVDALAVEFFCRRGKIQKKWQVLFKLMKTGCRDRESPATLQLFYSFTPAYNALRYRLPIPTWL